jgi:rhodanese-related sulfurtransferase
MRKMLKAVGVLLSIVSIAATAFAAYPEISRISNEELNSLIDSNAKVIILDTQPKMVYDSGHILGAVSFPWKEEISSADTMFLPKDNTLIVTYCDCGPGESDSAYVAHHLISLGFNNVKVLGEPGIRAWIQAGYPME